MFNITNTCQILLRIRIVGFYHQENQEKKPFFLWNILKKKQTQKWEVQMPAVSEPNSIIVNSIFIWSSYHSYDHIEINKDSTNRTLEYDVYEAGTNHNLCCVHEMSRMGPHHTSWSSAADVVCKISRVIRKKYSGWEIVSGD